MGSPATTFTPAPSSPPASHGLLALCEAANSAGNGEGEPSSTSTVSAPGLAQQRYLPHPSPVIIKAQPGGVHPTTPTSRGPVTSPLLGKKKTAAYIGVRRRPWGSYAAEIRNQITGAREWLGTFETAEEAAVVYDIRKRQIKGEATKCNFPPLSTDGKMVKREICPHGQNAPQRLTLQVPADWAAQVAATIKHSALQTLGISSPTVKQELASQGAPLGSSEFATGSCSAFTPLAGAASSEFALYSGACAEVRMGKAA